MTRNHHQYLLLHMVTINWFQFLVSRVRYGAIYFWCKFQARDKSSSCTLRGTTIREGRRWFSDVRVVECVCVWCWTFKMAHGSVQSYGDELC